MMRRIHLLNCFVATLLFSGCMGYQLGGSRPEGIESVSINPIINKTEEPALEIPIMAAMKERVQFDGRMKLRNNEEDADAVIDIVLTNYRLVPIAFRSDFRTTVLQYRLRIDAMAILRDTKTNEILTQTISYGEATFEFKSDLTNSKRDALPRAARDMAKFILDDLIERW
jgi:hypothetical protein